MKIIDLLNKIANGEIKEISKFIYKGDLYEQESNFEEFGNRKGYVYRRENGITLTNLDTLFDIHKLNDEVKVIEEPFTEEIKEIKTLNNVGNSNDLGEFKDKQQLNNHILKDKINEIIRKLNEVENESNNR